MHEIYNCRSRIGNGLAIHLIECCFHHHIGCPSTMTAPRNRMPHAINHKPDEPRRVQEDHQIIRLSGASPGRIRVCLLRTRVDGRREKTHFPTCHRLLNLSPDHGAAAGHVVALQLFRVPLRLILAPCSAAGSPGPYRSGTVLHAAASGTTPFSRDFNFHPFFRFFFFLSSSSPAPHHTLSLFLLDSGLFLSSILPVSIISPFSLVFRFSPFLFVFFVPVLVSPSFPLPHIPVYQTFLSSHLPLPPSPPS